jgi:CRISPR/Cas system-associated endoribonuclease Cas2
MDMKTRQRVAGKAIEAKVLVPVRYSAWLSGELGRVLTAALEAALARLSDDEDADVRVTRLPRGFLVEQEGVGAGALTERCIHAIREVEATTQVQYPVFYHESGPVGTGTVQVVVGLEPIDDKPNRSIADDAAHRRGPAQ